jgi:hypothetical protein
MWLNALVLSGGIVLLPSCCSASAQGNASAYTNIDANHQCSVHVALDYLHMLLPALATRFVGLERTRQIIDDKLNRVLDNPEDAAELVLSLERITPKSGLRLVKLRRKRLDALEHKIQFLQNPRSYARAINLLNRVGYHTADRLMVSYTHVLKPQIRLYRSPALLVEILLLLRRYDAARGSEWFQAAVAEISETGLKRRLAYGLDADLVFFPALITLIGEGDRHDLAQDLAKALARIDDLARRLPSECWFGMLRALRAAAPDSIETLIMKFDEVIVERSSQPVQRDDVTLWRAVGAHALLRHDVTGHCWDCFATCPNSLLIPKDPVTQLFATAWLEPTEWVRGFQDCVVRLIAENPTSVPSDMRQLLGWILQSSRRPEAMSAQSCPMPVTDDQVIFGPFRETDAEAVQALL